MSSDSESSLCDIPFDSLELSSWGSNESLLIPICQENEEEDDDSGLVVVFSNVLKPTVISNQVKCENSFVDLKIENHDLVSLEVCKKLNFMDSIPSVNKRDCKNCYRSILTLNNENPNVEYSYTAINTLLDQHKEKDCVCEQSCTSVRVVCDVCKERMNKNVKKIAFSPIVEFLMFDDDDEDRIDWRVFDIARFKHRIFNLDSIISPILNPEHRRNIFNKFNC